MFQEKTRGENGRGDRSVNKTKIFPYRIFVKKIFVGEKKLLSLTYQKKDRYTFSYQSINQPFSNQI
jgi:hypothetical protein